MDGWKGLVLREGGAGCAGAGWCEGGLVCFLLRRSIFHGARGHSSSYFSTPTVLLARRSPGALPSFAETVQLQLVSLTADDGGVGERAMQPLLVPLVSVSTAGAS